MRILPLGGAHEVGASSTIVEIGGHRVLVDAGIRIGAQGNNQLPDFGRIQEEAGEIDAIFLTHAHMDHSGALPLVHLAFPHAPIFMTPATYAVVRILFSDSLRLMEGRYEREGEIPLYPAAAVDSCMGKIRPVSFNYPLRFANRELCATFYPAGHILGASAIHIEGRDGSVLMSGDISVTDQRTVPGMNAPRLQTDVILVESTYGNRLHANRETQERNLVRTVAEVLESGGKVIIPAFAVGRAQEVILILNHAIQEKHLAPYPIYVDGLVRDVCDAYSRYPTYLQRYLRKMVQKGNHPFFPAGGSVQRVRSDSQRKKILAGPPCCVVASSGMMTGGPSAFYASALASDKNNLIAITGYQDEEAPGRKLLDLLDTPAEKRSLVLNDVETPVHCRVEKYSLSAHADSAEIAGLVSSIQPTQGVVLVHGDEEARGALASTIDATTRGRVFLPKNGEALEFQRPRRVFYVPTREQRKRKSVRIGLPNRRLEKSTLSHLHQALWAETGRQGLYQLSDLHARWYGPDVTPEADELERLRELLENQPYFTPDYKRTHMYRLRPPHKVVGKQESSESGKPGAPVLEMNQALQMVHACFPPTSGLYKRGARQDEQKLLLFFQFPHVAKKQYKRELTLLEEETGWSIELNEMPHHAALEEAARRIIPETWVLLKNPSILHEQQVVRLRVLQEGEEEILEQEAAECQQRYVEETGYELELHWVRQRSTKSRGKPTTDSHAPVIGPLEINQAYQRIEEFFATLPDRPYKKSKKGGNIVLSFLSQAVGNRYLAELDSLSKEIGWPLQVNPEPNQYGIKQEVRSMLPEDWSLRKEPGILRNRHTVRLVLDLLPPHQELEALAEEVYERTGFYLEVTEVSS